VPCEIDVEAIAYHCRAVVRYRKLDGCAARIIGHGDKAIISVDAHSRRERQRFSIGHELGHWMRDRGKAVYLCHDADIRSPWIHHGPEARANQFAANLLMPEFMFRPIARSHPMTFDTVNDLAKEFQTSRTATAIRLVEIGSYPAMLVCYGMGGRRWHIPGPDVPDVFWPHKELSHDTEAFTLLYGQPKQSQPVLADAASWIDHRSSSRYNIIEHSIRVGEEVLVLLWWKDESQILTLQS
jgi:hypothetical protein